ncbi:MAG TPA: putative zinc-binding protein [Noviherbaspirillum sp.]|uniref:putative zinc-binding protein n=1 Tax=Noviherbaspirillum sp. TaxID=1926288 RepID=UPI002B485617|nr:putative zinc-binding protein [Noviherbaspirillum sp.]HJV85066.1 putative zinc-binding protein [Noviherbaspirillum sp.]
MAVKDPTFPLVYSCSGCSSAAQTANYAAVRLDRLGVAEMSCIAGVGGDVPQLVRVAKSGRPIIGIDGCPLACVRSSLARHGVTPDHYHQLNDYGVKKRNHMDFDPEQGDVVVERVIADLEHHSAAAIEEQE